MGMRQVEPNQVALLDDDCNRWTRHDGDDHVAALSARVGAKSLTGRSAAPAAARTGAVEEASRLPPPWVSQGATRARKVSPVLTFDQMGPCPKSPSVPKRPETMGLPAGSTTSDEP